MSQTGLVQLVLLIWGRPYLGNPPTSNNFHQMVGFRRDAPIFVDLVDSMYPGWAHGYKLFKLRGPTTPKILCNFGSSAACCGTRTAGSQIWENRYHPISLALMRTIFTSHDGIMMEG